MCGGQPPFQVEAHRTIPKSRRAATVPSSGPPRNSEFVGKIIAMLGGTVPRGAPLHSFRGRCWMRHPQGGPVSCRDQVVATYLYPGRRHIGTISAPIHSPQAPATRHSNRLLARALPRCLEKIFADGLCEYVLAVFPIMVGIFPAPSPLPRHIRPSGNKNTFMVGKTPWKYSQSPSAEIFLNPLGSCRRFCEQDSHPLGSNHRTKFQDSLMSFVYETFGKHVLEVSRRCMARRVATHPARGASRIWAALAMPSTRRYVAGMNRAPPFSRGGVCTSRCMMGSASTGLANERDTAPNELGTRYGHSVRIRTPTIASRYR